MKVGVLALQGGFSEHVNHIKKLNHKAMEVRKKEDLDSIDGLIIPGGESTTMGKLLRETKMLEPLRNKIIEGMPTWGTCAGMILLAKEIEGKDNTYIGAIDIKVRRNAYGSQKDSFSVKKQIKFIGDAPQELVFIRAPYIDSYGDDVEELLRVDGKLVAAKQKNIFVTSFHPELTDGLDFHRYFLSIIERAS